MQLDVRTLVISLMLVAGVNSLVMLLAWRYTSSMRNITGFWSVSQLLFLLGTALLALRYAIPDFFSIVAGNVFLMGGQAALQEGLGHYIGQPGRYRGWVLSMVAVQLGLISFFTYFLPSLEWRIICYSVMSACLCIPGVLMLRKNGKQEEAPKRFLRGIFFVNMGIMAIRVVAAFVEPLSQELQAQTSLWHTLPLAGLLCVYVALSLGMFWMIMHKLSLQAQRQAETDSLTSVPNRRAMDGYFAQLYSHQQGAIAVMMIDIDKFKDINDSFGHRAGDCYLVSLAQEIKQNLQPEAALFRYAGDEFLVVMQQTDRQALTATAKIVQQKAENLLVPWGAGKIIQTTVSLGLAMSEKHASSWDELVQLADLAMYRVKSQGGNGVAWYEEEIKVKQSI